MELRGFLSKNQVLVGVQGAKPRKLVIEFIHLQCSSTLKMTRFSMFCLCLYSMMLHAN